MHKKSFLPWTSVVFVSIFLFSLPLTGQKTEQAYQKDEIWQIGDTARHNAACRGSIRTIENDDGDSNLYDHFSRVLISSIVYGPMWNTCAKELGYTYTKEGSLKGSLIPQGMRVCIDAQGNPVYLSLYMTRPTETKEEEDRMQRLMVKLKETRFPPFRKNEEENTDHMLSIKTYPRPTPELDIAKDTIIDIKAQAFYRELTHHVQHSMGRLSGESCNSKFEAYLMSCYLQIYSGREYTMPGFNDFEDNEIILSFYDYWFDNPGRPDRYHNWDYFQNLLDTTDWNKYTTIFQEHWIKKGKKDPAYIGPYDSTKKWCWKELFEKLGLFYDNN